jgi:hypothetical protein
MYNHKYLRVFSFNRIETFGKELQRKAVQKNAAKRRCETKNIFPNFHIVSSVFCIYHKISFTTKQLFINFNFNLLEIMNY